MLEVTGVSWELIGAIAAAIAAGIAAVVAVLISLKALRTQQQTQASMLAKLAVIDRDLGVLCSSASTAGDRLVHVERRSRELFARQDSIATTGAGSAHYRQAHALLERGATADELVRTCGMARGEADLVAYLHRDSASSLNS